jgi:hypothetical protein
MDPIAEANGAAVADACPGRAPGVRPRRADTCFPMKGRFYAVVPTTLAEAEAQERVAETFVYVRKTRAS